MLNHDNQARRADVGSASSSADDGRLLYYPKQHSVSAVWSDTDPKDLEPMGSLLKFAPVGQTGAFYATVATTGEVVFVA